MAELLLRLRDRELKKVPVLSVRTTVGRDAASHLVIDNAGVSRTHAVVVFADNTYRVQDAESQNGITLNGKSVKDAPLNYGDVIGIGKFEIEFLESSHAPVGGEMWRPPAVRNVMGTLQMDAAASARMRDEVMAKLAAQKNAAAAPAAADASSAGPRSAGPTSRAPGAAASTSRRPTPAKTSRRPAAPAPVAPPRAAGSDLVATLKLAGLVLLGVAVLVGGVLFLLSR